MTQQVELGIRNRNPDVLTSIANLSNDEVFTPPEFANRMLDTLAEAWAASNDGANIWADPNVTFLDPFTKSGVFLREITKRLVDGLESEIPDLQERVDHVLGKQVFGIAITDLTALLARRSLYCSKLANGKHSIATCFDSEQGNIWFERFEHSWAGRHCRFCGASREQMERGEEAETYAYPFIHTDDATALLAKHFGVDVKFDVIVGNPPYQLEDGGHKSSATPIYDRFVQQAKALEPRFLSMVIPSRWLVGGRKQLDAFRKQFLSDREIRSITDFITEKDAFPGVNINGGVLYFLREQGFKGECQAAVVLPGSTEANFLPRKLDEFDVFIRRPEALPIVRKANGLAEDLGRFSENVLSLRPFGLRTNFHGAAESSKSRSLKLYGSGKVSWVGLEQVEVNKELVDKWKVLLPAATDGNEVFPLPIWDSRGPFVAGPGELCSETYLVVYVASSESEANNAVSLLRTKTARFLVAQRKIAQHNKADNFRFLPNFALDRHWDEDALIRELKLSEEDFGYIDSQIRTMDWKS